jgi:hypothetical protein
MEGRGKEKYALMSQLASRRRRPSYSARAQTTSTDSSAGDRHRLYFHSYPTLHSLFSRFPFCVCFLLSLVILFDPIPFSHSFPLCHCLFPMRNSSANLFLGVCLISFAVTVGYVHTNQKTEREAMHKAVIADRLRLEQRKKEMAEMKLAAQTAGTSKE